MKDGFWDSGAYDNGGGYEAGQFKNNVQIEVKNAEGVGDRNVIIHAFENAEQAAKQLSKEYEKQGNKASSKYYKGESKKLSKQID